MVCSTAQQIELLKFWRGGLSAFIVATANCSMVSAKTARVPVTGADRFTSDLQAEEIRVRNPSIRI